jgi:phospholipid/cholesterol/gamma-HCH transport system substrate-binding protein
MEFRENLHTDSTASISQAGVLGDSFVDISSVRASGPPPPNNAELKTASVASIQDVIGSSQVSIQQVNELMKKLETLIDTLNSKKGTAGELINDPGLYKKLDRLPAICR